MTKSFRWTPAASSLAVRVITIAVLLIAAAVGSAWAATPAQAHSFLASTDPEQGARLPRAPTALGLQFSEEVTERGINIEVRTGGGEVVDEHVPRVESGGHVVRLPLSDLADGIYVVSWQVTSAVDGHESAGEFAFAVGVFASGELPSPGVDVGVDMDGWAVAATWVFFAGLAVAAGGLAGAPALGHDSLRRRAWLRAGAATALVAIGWHSWIATRSAVSGTEAVALLVATGTLLGTMMAARAASPLPAAVLLTAVASAWSARSHSATANGAAGWLLDAAHVIAAAVWAGALAYVTAALWRQRGDRGQLLLGIGRYARLAAVLVAVVAATGVVQAVLLLPAISALWNTGYGRILTIKSILFAVALAAAAVARASALPRQRSRLLQRLTTSEVTAVAAVMAAAALLVNAAPPQRDASASLLGPPPIEGDVVHDMGMAGTLTVDLKAGDGRLDVEVMTTSGGVEGAAATMVARYPDGRSVELNPRPCGAGCYTQELTLPAGTTEVTVTASAPGWTGGTMRASLHWPPPEAQPERFEQMVTAMRRVPALQLTEQVSSGVGVGGTTEAEISGDQFVEVMPWANGGVTDVRPLPDDDSAFSFYLPGSSMYFVAWVDGRGRLTQQRMVNPGHEIDYGFDYGD